MDLEKAIRALEESRDAVADEACPIRCATHRSHANCLRVHPTSHQCLEPVGVLNWMVDRLTEAQVTGSFQGADAYWTPEYQYGR